jgi:hypothetical protein
MKNLSTFVQSFDFVHAEPTTAWLADVPRDVFVASLARLGEDYVAYFADARERKDPMAGSPVTLTVSLKLPEGNFTGRTYSPVSGTYSAEFPIRGGKDTKVELPAFTQDVVVRVTRK